MCYIHKPFVPDIVFYGTLLCEKIAKKKAR